MTRQQLDLTYLLTIAGFFVYIIGRMALCMYWPGGWHGMTAQERSMIQTGALLTRDEVLA